MAQRRVWSALNWSVGGGEISQCRGVLCGSGRMSSCLLSGQKEEMAFEAQETAAGQISWRYGIAWPLGNTADSGYG